MVVMKDKHEGGQLLVHPLSLYPDLVLYHENIRNQKNKTY